MAGSTSEERLRALAVAALRVARPGARIVHELNMEGQGSIRLDLAAVDADHLILVEIKSEKDVLKRLKDQLAAAQNVANEVWLVITIKHAEAILAAADYKTGFLEGDAELYTLLRRTRILIENTQGELQVLTAGRFTVYDGHNLLPDPRKLFAVLWSIEMWGALMHLGAGRSTMSVMTRFAVEELTGAQIRRAVCAALRSRPFARADAPIETPVASPKPQPAPQPSLI